MISHEEAVMAVKLEKLRVVRRFLRQTRVAAVVGRGEHGGLSATAKKEGGDANAEAEVAAGPEGEEALPVNLPDSSGKLTTMLHWAAYVGSVDLTALLLDHGAHTDVEEVDGKTPLHWAAFEGHAGVVKLLLARGASYAMRDLSGATACHLAIRGRQYSVAELLPNYDAVVLGDAAALGGVAPAAFSAPTPDVSLQRAAAAAAATAAAPVAPVVAVEARDAAVGTSSEPVVVCSSKPPAIRRAHRRPWSRLDRSSSAENGADTRDATPRSDHGAAAAATTTWGGGGGGESETDSAAAAAAAPATPTAPSSAAEEEEKAAVVRAIAARREAALRRRQRKADKREPRVQQQQQQQQHQDVQWRMENDDAHVRSPGPSEPSRELPLPVRPPWPAADSSTDDQHDHTAPVLAPKASPEPPEPQAVGSEEASRREGRQRRKEQKKRLLVEQLLAMAAGGLVGEESIEVEGGGTPPPEVAALLLQHLQRALPHGSVHDASGNSGPAPRSVPPLPLPLASGHPPAAAGVRKPWTTPPPPHGQHHACAESDDDDDLEEYRDGERRPGQPSHYYYHGGEGERWSGEGLRRIPVRVPSTRFPPSTPLFEPSRRSSSSRSRSRAGSQQPYYHQQQQQPQHPTWKPPAAIRIEPVSTTAAVTPRRAHSGADRGGGGGNTSVVADSRGVPVAAVPRVRRF